MTEEAAPPESFSATYLGLAACMCIAPATQRRWEARFLIASDADVDLAEKTKYVGRALLPIQPLGQWTINSSPAFVVFR